MYRGNQPDFFTPFVHPGIKEIEGYFHDQERGDAELLTKLLKEEFLYDHIAQSWLRYENGVWNQDQEKQTLRIAVEELTKVYLAASSEIDQQITELIAEKKEANQERIGRLEGLRDNLRTRVNKLNNRNRINNVLKMAESWLPTSTGSSIETL